MALRVLVVGNCEDGLPSIPKTLLASELSAYNYRHL